MLGRLSISQETQVITSGWPALAAEFYDVIKPFAARRTIPAGTCFLDDSTLADTVWLVVGGSAKAEYYSVNGQEIWVSDFEPGETIGPASVLAPTLHGLRFIADTDLDVLSISQAKFEELISEHASVGYRVSEDLAGRLNTATGRMIERATLKAPARVCAELVRMSRAVGKDEEQLLIRPIPVFAKMAIRVYSTRETVSRTINKLQKSGVISREPGAILVRKPDVLRAHIDAE